MTTDQALTKVFTLLERVQSEPSQGVHCEAELTRAIQALEANEIEVPAALTDLCAKLRAEKRAFEAQEMAFDNMPI